MSDKLDEFFDFMDDMSKRLNSIKFLNNDMMELAAIWLHEPINGKRRFAEGDLVAIENDKLIESDHATHKIVGCFGTIGDSRHEMLLTDILTCEPKVLIL